MDETDTKREKEKVLWQYWKGIQKSKGYKMNSFLDWIFDNLPEGSKILEFGSGEGTIELTKKYSVTSIEHDPMYVNMSPSNYIYAPIVNGWYDIEKLQGLKRDFDLILIDGPTGKIGRWGLLDNMDLFKWKTTIIVDDVNRAKEWELFQGLMNIIDPQRAEIIKGTDRKFAVIYANR